MIQREKQKVKPKLKVAEDFLNLKTLDTNVIVKHLEEQIKLREIGVEKSIRQKKARKIMESL